MSQSVADVREEQSAVASLQPGLRGTEFSQQELAETGFSLVVELDATYDHNPLPRPDIRRETGGNVVPRLLSA